MHAGETPIAEAAARIVAHFPTRFRTGAPFVFGGEGVGSRPDSIAFLIVRMSIFSPLAAALIEVKPKHGTGGRPPPCFVPQFLPRTVDRHTPKARAAAEIEAYVTPSTSIGFAFL